MCLHICVYIYICHIQVPALGAVYAPQQSHTKVYEQGHCESLYGRTIPNSRPDTVMEAVEESEGPGHWKRSLFVQAGTHVSQVRQTRRCM